MKLPPDGVLPGDLVIIDNPVRDEKPDPEHVKRMYDEMREIIGFDPVVPPLRPMRTGDALMYLRGLKIGEDDR